MTEASREKILEHLNFTGHQLANIEWMLRNGKMDEVVDYAANALKLAEAARKECGLEPLKRDPK
jgi:hypothetical protein